MKMKKMKLIKMMKMVIKLRILLEKMILVKVKPKIVKKALKM